MTLKFVCSYITKEVESLSLADQGLYVWLLKKSSKARLPIDYPAELIITIGSKEYYILYVGIGPEKEGLSSTLTSRLIWSHIKGNIYGSTFRYSMSALLDLQFLCKTKCNKDGKFKKAYYLSSEDEARLNDFLEKHCEVSIIELNKPWDVEKAVIANYAPPLNIEHNKNGWHYKNIRRFRKLSRTRSIPFE
jgi:hypothetical protein